MTTLQEYLNQKYPTKKDKEKVKKIDFYEIYLKDKILEIRELDLSDFSNLEIIYIGGHFLNFPLTKLTLNNCANLKELNCSGNELVSVDFLNRLTNPEKLEKLSLFNNNIQSTDIDFFSKFANLKEIRLGTTKNGIKSGKRNSFYGSFQSWKNLNKLKLICIETTDVDSGLEYLSTCGGLKYLDEINCQPNNTNSKCAVIQNTLRPFNYDLEAWQLAHPHKIYQARPEYFFNSDTKSKWITSLRDKMANTQSKLKEIKQNNPDKVNKIKRLETKLYNLELIRDNISNHSLIEELSVKKETVNKQTQTEMVRLPK